MIYGCLLAGVYFSLRMRFPQLRLIKDMVGQLFSGKSSASGVSSFQGFAMALGGRVGTGNITGVASAIFFGGPGAVFWMWAIAFLGGDEHAKGITSAHASLVLYRADIAVPIQVAQIKATR